MRAIRAVPELSALPILAMTAKAMTEDRERAIAAGASDWMSKPVNPDELVGLIGMWLNEVTEPRRVGALKA